MIVLMNLIDCKSSDPASPYYSFRQQMNEVVETELTSLLKDEAYSQIRTMIKKPYIEENEINLFWYRTFAYIIQRIKMWNGYVAAAQNIADLVIRKEKQKEPAGDSQTSESIIKTPQKTKTSEMSV